MALVQQEVVAQLRRFIVEHVLGREVLLLAETPLLDSGLITSLQAIEVEAFVEQTFHVKVDLDLEHFRSLATIAAQVCARAGGA